MVMERQTSFAAGELSPDLWGRTDSELYDSGARKLRNFIVKPQGPLVSRPGTVKLATCKPGQSDVALLGFSYSETLVYVLELGDHYLRVHSPLQGYTGIELATPWSTAQAKALQVSQVGRVMVLCHKDVLAQELTMTLVGTTPTWALTQARWYPPSDTPVGSSTPEMLTPRFYRNSGGIAGYMVPPVLLAAKLVAPGDEQPTVVETFVGDDAHTPAAWKWRYSTLFRNVDTGELVESVSMPVTCGVLSRAHVPDFGDGTIFQLNDRQNMVVVEPDRPVKLVCPTWTGEPVAIGAAGYAQFNLAYQHWKPVRQLFYRGWGDRYGYVGSTDDAGQDFVDVGDIPDWNNQPLMRRYPTTIDDEYAQYVPMAVNHPPASAVAHHAGRRCFAVGQAIAASRVDEWSNFDLPPGSADEAQALEYTIASLKRMDVSALLSHARLLAFVDEGVWGCEVGLSNVQFQQESAVGAASGLQPLVVDGAVLYVRQRGKGLYGLTLDSYGNYQGIDASWHAAHLFESAKVVSWCHQRWPFNCAWLVTSAGELLTATPTGRGWAWAKHTTTGTVKAVASVTTTDADVVLVAVKRGSTLCIERVCDRATEGRYALDSAAEVSSLAGHTATVSGLSHLNGLDVWVVPSIGPPQGPLKVVGGEVTTEEVLEGPDGATHDEFGNAIHITVRAGLAFTPELELLDARSARTAQKTVVSVGFEVQATEGLWVGQDDGVKSMREWQRRTVTDSFDFPSDATGLAVVNVGGTWSKSGRAVLQQRLPLPVTVLGITRDLRAGG